MKPKHLFILSVVLALMLAGCVASGPVKKDQTLTPLTDKIYLEEHDQNFRSYHMEMADDFKTEVISMEIYSLNGIQDVAVIPYQVIVKKSPFYKWKTIEPEILRILKQ